MRSPLLHVASLTHAYGAHTVLADIDLAIGPSTLTALLGSSGVGKSTLLRAIAGFITPQAGTITLRGEPMVIDGREVTPAERRGVGMVFQDHALFPHMTAAENIAFGLDAWSSDEASSRCDEMLALVGLADRAEALPEVLSGGQRQRIALARALAPRPTLLLLDEPFASLDAELRRELADELRTILQREQVAALLVTHDHRAALAWCDQVAIIGAQTTDTPGRLHQHDTPEGVYQRPSTEVAARLTGEALFLDATAEGQVATSALGAARLVEPRDGPCRLMVRPEQLHFRSNADGEATVSGRRFEGATVRLQVDSPAGRLSLETAAHGAPAIGTQGTVTLEAKAWALPPQTMNGA
jgi:iron(III) transport system ATP-binding protein